MTRAVVLLGALAAVAMFLGSVTSGDRAPMDAGAWGVAAVAFPAAFSVTSAWWPRVSVIAAPLATIVCFATITPAFAIAFALVVPLYAAGRRGHLWWGAASIVVTVAVTSVHRLFFEAVPQPVGALALDVLRDSSLLVAMLLLGDAVRSRQRARHEADLEREVREAEHQRRLSEQRLETARDLHDVLAHTLTVVSIQGSVVAEQLEEADPAAPTVQAAVAQLRRSTADALADLRGTIGLLRQAGAEAPSSPAPGLAQIHGLVDRARESGLRVEAEIAAPREVRAAISLAAYRVVQEALTNVLRHAAATRVTVHVRSTGGDLVVLVRDDGRASPGPEGFGLRGMRERVESLGGSLSHGPVPGGGFAVRARLPEVHA